MGLVCETQQRERDAGEREPTYRMRRVAASNLIVLGDLDRADSGRQQRDERAVGLAAVGDLSSRERELAPVLGADVVRVRNVGTTANRDRTSKPTKQQQQQQQESGRAREIE